MVMKPSRVTCCVYVGGVHPVLYSVRDVTKF